ncbi:MAG: FHA domain-containing protein [Chloroflexi bacterium]|nr:FHA domain-containing protein [Chloroflexota bacterium]
MISPKTIPVDDSQPIDASKEETPKLDKNGLSQAEAAAIEKSAEKETVEEGGKQAEEEAKKTYFAPTTDILHPPGKAYLQVNRNDFITMRDSDMYDVGRLDPGNDWLPAVDLTPYGGETGGVSRQHGRFLYRDGQFSVEDMGSTNGTFVNDKKIAARKKFKVNTGDRIRFGRVTVIFHII